MNFLQPLQELLSSAPRDDSIESNREIKEEATDPNVSDGHCIFTNVQIQPAKVTTRKG
jgi:hypothetical protein